MKLMFRKGEDGEITVRIKEDATEKEFSYVEMIQYLYDKNNLEEPEFTEDISDEQQVKIKDMITKMNEIIVVNEVK